MKYRVYGRNKGKQSFWSRKVSEWSSGVGSADSVNFQTVKNHVQEKP